ncbi:MAG: ABC transporter substrate-binding protein [Verrucomicrobiota bacterium]
MKYPILISIVGLALAACGEGPKDPETIARENEAFLVEPQYESIDQALQETRTILQPNSYLYNDFIGKELNATPNAPLETLKVGLSWIANDQFSAYYVASAKGFFQEAGFAVELLPGGPGKNPLGLLVAGQLDFVSSSNGSAVIRMQHSPNGGDLVAVGALLRRYPYAWIGLDNSVNSDTPSNRPITADDLRGRKMGAEPGSEFLAAYTLEKLGLSPSDVIFTRTSTQIEPLLEGAFDYMTCWVDNMPRMLDAMGHKNWFLWEFEDNGWADYGNVVVTTRQMVEDHPRKIERYLWALTRAVEYIISSPEASAQIVLDAMEGTNLNLDLIRSRLAYQKELSTPIKGNPFFHIDPDKWDRSAALLLYYGVIENRPPFSQVSM